MSAGPVHLPCGHDGQVRSGTHWQCGAWDRARAHASKSCLPLATPLSGKSTVGRLLAEALQYCFFDTDALIEQVSKGFGSTRHLHAASVAALGRHAAGQSA